MSTGKRIQAKREGRKLTRHELAQLFGTTRMTIYRVEKDLVSWPTNKLGRLAKILKTTVAELVA